MHLRFTLVAGNLYLRLPNRQTSVHAVTLAQIHLDDTVVYYGTVVQLLIETPLAFLSTHSSLCCMSRHLSSVRPKDRNTSAISL
jgi:hypothetical protein